LWIQLLKYVRFIPQCGILLRIVAKMIAQVVVFLVIFITVVVGFALAFHMLIGDAAYRFRGWGVACLSLFRMVVGDIDYEEIEATYNWLAVVLFFVYVAVSAILLLNLLIAMLNTAYVSVERATGECFYSLCVFIHSFIVFSFSFSHSR
jgi:polycystin 2